MLKYMTSTSGGGVTYSAPYFYMTLVSADLAFNAQASMMHV